MFAAMQVLLEKMAKMEIKVKQKSGFEVSEMIADLNKRLQQKGYESFFPLFRAKIE
jgi:hypothetical protein